MQNSNQTPAAVPYYIHEGITARYERTTRRLTLACTICVVSLAAVCMALIQKQQ